MMLDNFMADKFPGLKLESPLFYSWDAGIRFELGVNESSVSIHDNPLYLQEAYSRAIALFEALHAPDDKLYLVVDVYTAGSRQRKSTVFAKYVKGNSVRHRLQHEKLSYISPEDQICRQQRFSLTCSRADLRYAALLKAICNQDMGISPSVHHPVYFVNETKGTIYYVYDDRGCDLLGTDTEAIRWVYEKYNDWALDYDRAKIEEMFV